MELWESFLTCFFFFKKIQTLETKTELEKMSMRQTKINKGKIPQPNCAKGTSERDLPCPTGNLPPMWNTSWHTELLLERA